MSAHIPWTGAGIGGIDKHALRADTQGFSHGHRENGVETLPHFHSSVVDIDVAKVVELQNNPAGV